MVKREIQIGQHTLSIETGRLAKQADGAVVVRMGDTMVLVSACHASSAREGIDFLPLTVDYREYTYASGRIPGGFFKREGKATEKETLTSRLIDRPIRPLFPAGWSFETQVIAFVLSADTDHDSDVLAITGASAAVLPAATHVRGGAPVLWFGKTPLQPPEALAVASHVANAEFMAAWVWQAATVVFVGQVNTIVGAAATVKVAWQVVVVGAH